MTETVIRAPQDTKTEMVVRTEATETVITIVVETETVIVMEDVAALVAVEDTTTTEGILDGTENMTNTGGLDMTMTADAVGMIDAVAELIEEETIAVVDVERMDLPVLKEGLQLPKVLCQCRSADVKLLVGTFMPLVMSSILPCKRNRQVCYLTHSFYIVLTFLYRIVQSPRSKPNTDSSYPWYSRFTPSNACPELWHGHGRQS